MKPNIVFIMVDQMHHKAVSAYGRVPLYVWMQTGQGTLPVHWLLDDQGRTQLMTHSVLNWALKSFV